MKPRLALLIGLLFLLLACNLPRPAPTPDLLATLAASPPTTRASTTTPPLRPTASAWSTPPSARRASTRSTR